MDNYSFIILGSVVVFLSIILFSFLKLFCRGDNTERAFQKIVGGLSVFIVAIIAQDGWVFIFSLFIGGLIIASEDFMKALAAIMKSDPQKMAETIRALTVKANEDEVKEKIGSEDADDDSETQARLARPEVNAEQPSAQPNQTNSTGKMLARLEKVMKVEGLVQVFLSKLFGESYQSNMKLLVEEREILLDGIVKNSEGAISAAAEIKLVTEKSFKRLKFIIRNFRERMNLLGIGRIIFVIVSEGMNSISASQIIRDVGSDADLMLFRFDGADNIELLASSSGISRN